MEYRKDSRETTVTALSPSNSVTDREKEQGIKATGILVINGDIAVTGVKLVEGKDSMYVRFPGYYSGKDGEFKPYVSGTSREFRDAAAAAMDEARPCSGIIVQKKVTCDRNAVRFNPYSREGSDLAGFATLACTNEGKQVFAINTIKIHDKGDRLTVETPEGVILPPHLKREIARECVLQHPELDRTKEAHKAQDAQREAKDGREKDETARQSRRRKSQDIEQ